MSENFEDYEKKIKDLERYYLTLDRESLNEVLSFLSSKGKIDVLVDEIGDISFDIPKKSKINVTSINIPDIMMGVLLEIEKDQATYEVDSNEYNALEDKKDAIRFSIDMTKTILNEHKEDDDVLEKGKDEDS